MKKFNFSAIPVIALAFITAFASCSNNPDSSTGRLSYDEAVKKVTFTGNTATVNFENLENNNIYLVKINTSNLAVPAANTGGAAASLGLFASDVERLRSTLNSPAVNQMDTYLCGLNHALDLNMDLLSFDRKAPDRARTSVGLASYATGDKKYFWVELDDKYERKEATLMASGVHGNIWVMNENSPSGSSDCIITERMAQGVAEKFDQIYLLETKLLGYEYGGGPGGDGGTDGDKKVQILIYDMGAGTEAGTTLGFFFNGDMFPQSVLDIAAPGYKSNEAEMFYINALVLLASPNLIYSTLVHEFQHMINFSRKLIEHIKLSAVWYNEMLSQLAEDVISPLLGIRIDSDDLPIMLRIPGFLYTYYENGITEWNGTLESYSITFAFGAYLVRNYGGPILLKRLLDNEEVDIDSITLALKEFDEDMDFDKALNRFGEALIFSGPTKPEGAATFYKTVTSTVNGQRYTAYGFDIWPDGEGFLSVLDLTAVLMRPHSVVVHSIDEWKEKTGTFSVTLRKPSSENVVFYLMVR